MEGSPLSLEGDAENQGSRRKKELEENEARKSRVKKPENLGFLAVESEPEAVNETVQGIAKEPRVIAPETIPEQRAELPPPPFEIPALKEVEFRPPAPVAEAAPPMPEKSSVVEESKPPATLQKEAPSTSSEEDTDRREFKFTEGPEEPEAVPPDFDIAEKEPEKPESHKDNKPALNAQEQAPKPSERIGHVLLGNEAGSEAGNQKEREGKAPSKNPLEGQYVETMSSEELLDLAEKIHINGDNLRHIYETHLIGERGLHRLIEEYKKGGDLQEALRREMLERERDFERDPAMRDHVSHGSEAAGKSATGLDDPAIQELLGKTGSTASGGAKSSDKDRKAANRYETSRRGGKHYKRIVDVIFFGIIGLLVLLVIIIYLQRG